MARPLRMRHRTGWWSHRSREMQGPAGWRRPSRSPQPTEVHAVRVRLAAKVSLSLRDRRLEDALGLAGGGVAGQRARLRRSVDERVRGRLRRTRRRVDEQGTRVGRRERIDGAVGAHGSRAPAVPRKPIAAAARASRAESEAHQASGSPPRHEHRRYR